MTPRPKVLHILAPTREGGLERVVTMLAAGQRNEGVHVAAVLEPRTAVNHPFVSRLESLRIPVTPVIVGARAYLQEYRALRALISALRPEIVHTHGYRSDVIGAFAARRSRVPVVSTVHGFTGGGWRNRVNELAQVFALRRAAAVIAVAAPLVDRLAAAGVARRRIHCIANAFTPAMDRLPRNLARRELGLDDDSLYAGWVGRLSAEKGADVMLRALSLAEPRWKLSVVGEGPESEPLLRLASDLGITGRVVWHGERANAARYFPAFDAFVLSSRTEGTPITLFEAMDAGVPVVASRVGGVPDVVTGQHAILVPSEDPAAIAAALLEIATDPVAATQRAALARARMISSFSGGAWLANVDAAYREALAVPGKNTD